MLNNIRLRVKYTHRFNSVDIRALDAQTLYIKAPQGSSAADIREVLEREEEKILLMLADAAERYSSIDYQSGCKVLYKGSEITLQFAPLVGYKWRFLKAESILRIDHALRDQAELVLKNFYECQAEEMRIRCKHLALHFGTQPRKISLRWTSSRWGSCSGNGNISLSRALIMAPEEIQDYIILHELCHLVVPAHSKDFYALMKKMDPNFREHHKWLKENGWRLKCFPQKS